MAAPLRQTRDFQLICAGSASVVVIPSARQFLRVWRLSRTNTESWMQIATDVNASRIQRQPHNLAPSSFLQEQRSHHTTMPDNIRKGGRITVDIRKGQRWRCQNPKCRSEIFVSTSSRAQGGSNLRCSCGEIMKKPYVRPGLNTFESAKKEHRSLGVSPS